MKKLLKLTIIVLFLAISLFGFTQHQILEEPTEDEFQAIVEKLKESTVSVLLYDLEFQIGLGSGMIYKKEDSPHGKYYYYVVTNNHVANSSPYVKLQMNDGTIEIGDIYGLPESDASGSEDIAVIRFESEKVYPVIPMPESPNELNPIRLTVGQSVFGIGTPINLKYANNVSDMGIVSKQTISFIVHTANINPGNSGGPLFTMNGQFIGINTQRLEYLNGEIIDGISESIIVDKVAVLVKSLTDNIKPKLGISIRSIESFVLFNYAVNYGDQAKDFIAREKIPNFRDGVVVTSVGTTRPSHGILQMYDLIVAVNGYNIFDMDDLTFKIGTIEVGNNYDFDVYRKNTTTGEFELLKLSVTIT